MRLAKQVYFAADVILLILVIYFVLAFAGFVPRPTGPGAARPGVAALVIAVLVALLQGAGIAAVLSATAARKAWLWPLAALPPILFFAPDVGQLLSFILRPRSAIAFVLAALALASLVSLVISALVLVWRVRIAQRSSKPPMGA